MISPSPVSIGAIYRPYAPDLFHHIFLLFSYYFSSTGGREQDCWSFEKPAQYFIDMQSLVYYSDKHILIGQLMLAAFSVAFVLTIWNRIQRLVQPDLELPLWRTLSRSGTSV